MDSCGFDKLSKAVAAGASRRTIVRMLAGGLFGGIATVAGGGQAGAVTCRSQGRLCIKGANCCSDVCCDNRCVSQNSTSPVSVANCGACGRDCSRIGEGGIVGCVHGDCVAAVQICNPSCFNTGRADCDGDGEAETLLGTPTNCGFCGNDCTANTNGENLCIVKFGTNVYGCGNPFEPHGTGGGFPFATGFD